VKKTYELTITLTYQDITNETELKKAVFDEAKSWVESGSFDDELQCAAGNGELTSAKVVIKEKK
jgi:hypothetical protein